MEKREESFDYTYSAEQQAEVERIRRKYLPAQENKLEQLRRLDRTVSRKAQSCAITLGVVGALILGTGMSLAMTPLGEALGALSMLLGICVGVVGLVLTALAYPAYNSVLKKQREKIAPEILRLSQELIN